MLEIILNFILNVVCSKQSSMKAIFVEGTTDGCPIKKILPPELWISVAPPELPRASFSSQLYIRKFKWYEYFCKALYLFL